MSSDVEEQCGAIHPHEEGIKCLKHNRCLWPNLHCGVREVNGAPSYFVHWAVTDKEELESIQGHEDIGTILENLTAAQKALRTLEVSIAAMLSNRKGLDNV